MKDLKQYQKTKLKDERTATTGEVLEPGKNL